MIIAGAVCFIAGYYVASTGAVSRLFQRLRYNEPEDEVEEEVEDEVEASKVVPKPRRVSIFPKKKNTRAEKYYPTQPKRYDCDLIRYENGMVTLFIADSLEEVEYKLKDIDTMII